MKYSLVLFPTLVFSVGLLGCPEDSDPYVDADMADMAFTRDMGTTDVRPAPDTRPSPIPDMAPDATNNDNGFGSCSVDCPPDLDIASATCSFDSTLSVLTYALVMNADIAAMPEESAYHEVTFSNGGPDEFVMRITMRGRGQRCDGFMNAGGGNLPAGAFTNCEFSNNSVTASIDTNLVTENMLTTPFAINDIYSTQDDATGMRKSFTGPNGGPIACDEL